MDNQPKSLWRVFVAECIALVLECFMPLIVFAKQIRRYLRK
jgi:hypothetical protein